MISFVPQKTRALVARETNAPEVRHRKSFHVKDNEQNLKTC